MPDGYQLTERQRKVEILIEYLRRKGFLIEGHIQIKMRDCDDVQKYIERMQKAHEETAKSKLRFGVSKLVISLN